MNTSNISSVSSRPPPSRWWYVFAVFLVICGGAFMTAFLLPRIQALPERLPQFVVPGETTIEVEEPASFTIFHEVRGVVDGEVIASPSFDGLRVKVFGPNGDAVSVSTSQVASQYSVGGRSGKSLLGFEAEQVGGYRIVGAYKTGAKEPRVVLAVGSGFLQHLLTTIAGAFAILAVGIAAGGLVALMTWRKRRRRPEV